MFSDVFGPSSCTRQFFKIELPCRRELDFERPRSLKILLFLFRPRPNFFKVLWAHGSRGGVEGDPVGKLERTRGAAAHVYNA